jgi:hypothetical protein
MLKDRSLWGTWSLLAAWILASAVGWAAGLAFGALLTYLASQAPWLNEDRVFAHAIMIALGITVGAAQAVVLRRLLPRAGRRVAATLLGHLLILAGSNAARLGGLRLWNNAVLLGLFGAAIGTCQWWLLRGRYRQAGFWVLATAVGFLSLLWMISHPAHSLGESVIKVTALGALASIVPGALLVWLLRQPVESASQGAA